MTTTDSLSVLRDILERDFGIERQSVIPDAVFGDDIDFDSIDAIDLAHRLEDRLGVDFGDDGFLDVRVVADVLAILDAAVAAAGGA
jgi:acyl carrier protein